jgi:hypothetical protein
MNWLKSNDEDQQQPTNNNIWSRKEVAISQSLAVMEKLCSSYHDLMSTAKGHN